MSPEEGDGSSLPAEDVPDAAADIEISDAARATAAALATRARELTVDLPLDLDIHAFGRALEALAPGEPER